MSSTGASYRSALRNRDFRLLSGALAQSMMGDWAYNVALIVYIYDQTHSAAWVSAGTLGRMIPAFFASPYGGVVAERFERVRLMINLDLMRCCMMVLLTVITATESPVWMAIAVAGINAVIASAYAPATNAMVPQLVRE